MLAGAGVAIGAAWSGMLGNFAFGVRPEKLKDIGVWGTMLEGRVQPLPRAAKSVASLGGDPAAAGAEAAADAAMTDLLAARLVALLKHAHGIEMRFRRTGVDP